jgi:thymidine phosphorylase
MLVLGGLAENERQALDALDRHWQTGEVTERFARMVSALGGSADLMETYQQTLPEAPVIEPLYPDHPGSIQSIDMRAIGLSVVALGGGRRRAADAIDPAVGLSQLAQPGETVDRDRPLAVIHARDRSAAERAAREIRAAVTIGHDKVGESSLVIKLISAQVKGD